MLIRQIAILFLLTSVQLIWVHSTYGQDIQNDTTILLNAFKKISSKEQIVYVDTVNPNSSGSDRLKELIKGGTFTDKRNDKRIILNSTEQDYLLVELAKQVVWSDTLFANSKRIDADSMWTYLKQENKKLSDLRNQAALKMDTTTYKKLQYEHQYVFTFAKPIYIRNNTVCLINIKAICGSTCGQEETSFYKKENKKWIKWIEVSHGDY